MRASLLISAALVVAACGERAAEPPAPAPAVSRHPRLTAGEQRVHIAPKGEAAATLRNGPNVPIALPAGFSLYPGARVIGSTVVERGGKRHALLVFETADPIEKVILHYRAEARAAALTVALDLGGSERASFGGTLPSGAEVAISARRDGRLTRAEFAHS